MKADSAFTGEINFIRVPSYLEFPTFLSWSLHSLTRAPFPYLFWSPANRLSPNGPSCLSQIQSTSYLSYPSGPSPYVALGAVLDAFHIIEYEASSYTIPVACLVHTYLLSVLPRRHTPSCVGQCLWNILPLCLFPANPHSLINIISPLRSQLRCLFLRKLLKITHTIHLHTKCRSFFYPLP